MESIFPGMTSAPNLHPMVVHFPIAFWLAAAGAWAVAVLHRRDDAWRFGLWLQTLGLLGAGVAVGLGFWATEKMGHDSPGHDLVHVHRNLMLVATGVALVITLLGWWRGAAGLRWRVGLSVLAGVLVGVMTLGADRGIELVFRYGIGVAGDPLPDADGYDHDHGGHDHGGSGAHGADEASDSDHPSPPAR